MLTSFIATTSKRLDYVCPAANRTWQRLTIISCDLTHERDTYFLNISHIIYLNYYLPRINRLQSKPLRLIKTNRVNSIIRHRMWLYHTPRIIFYLQGKINCSTIAKNNNLLQHGQSESDKFRNQEHYKSLAWEFSLRKIITCYNMDKVNLINLGTRNITSRQRGNLVYEK